MNTASAQQGLQPAPPEQQHADSHLDQPAQQHPIGLYFKVWGLLFLLSALSYLVDLFHVQGLLRWTLILLLMVAKAALIVAVFMHLRWERLALIALVIVPPAALLVLAGMMVVESDYVFMLRSIYLR